MISTFRRRAGLTGLTLAVIVVTALPAGAEPPPVTPSGLGNARFQQSTLTPGTKVQGRPQGLSPTKTVSALVQLDGAPSGASGSAASAVAARHRVSSGQDSAIRALAAAGATTYGRLTTVLNAVQVRVRMSDLDRVAAVPGVRTVQVSRTVRTENAASDRYTGVDRTWQSLGLTGRGQVIAIIDTGLDYTHADFGGAGTPAAFKANDGTVIEPTSFPTAKVIGGYDFVGDDYDSSSNDPSKQIPHPDPDPLDCNGHGTHVAGTAAGSGVTATGATYRGRYDRATLDRTWQVAPGSAPEAKLRAYRVFGCDGSGGDDVITAAIDRAVADGADIISMSLGSTFYIPYSLETAAIDAATRAGVQVVAAAGNEGAGAYVLGAPAGADNALAVAAVDAEMPTLPSADISGAVEAAALVANQATISTPITGTLVDVGLGCAADDYAGVAGAVAVATRGACNRIDRPKLGQAAGAVAVIMINNAAGLPPLEGPIEGVAIPFLGVPDSSSAALKGAAGKQVTISAGDGIPNPTYGRAAEFTSNGPRATDSAQKPDVAAPGVAVPSAAVGTGTGYVRESGTSMATPHTAGVAALVRQAHPSWTAAQVKAVIMSTAAPGKVAGYDGRRVGVGLVQPLRASAAGTYTWTPSGLNSLRFGAPQLSAAYADTQQFNITNRTKRSVTYDLRPVSSSESFGASMTVSPQTVRIPPGQTASAALTIRLSEAALAKLPGTEANDGGALTTLNGLVSAVPRTRRADVLPLRITFMLVPNAVSDIQAPSRIRTVDGRGSIPVRNTGVHIGAADVYAALLTDPAGDTDDPLIPDLTDVGVQSLPGEVVGAPATDRLVVFAVGMAAGTSTQAMHEIDLLIDVDHDGQPDFDVMALDRGYLTTGVFSGVVASATIDLSSNEIVDLWTAAAPANGSTLELPVLASALGLTAGRGSFTLTATEGYGFVSADPDRIDGTATFDAYTPALSQGALVNLRPGAATRLPVMVDPAAIDQTRSGWLIVSLDDRAGRREVDRVLIAPAGTPAVVAPR